MMETNMNTNMNTRSMLLPLWAALAFTFCATATADIASGVTRMEVAGIDVIVYPTAVQDVVTIVGSLPAGDLFARQLDDDGNIAVPTLVGMMLDKGTTRQDKFQIASQLERVGAGLSFGAGDQMVSISGRSLKKDLGLVIDLMAEQLRMPAFDAGELETSKKQLTGGARRQLEDTGAMAGQAMGTALFPEGHPNHPHTVEAFLEAIPQVSVADLQAFHRRHYGPEHMTLVFVGDVDAGEIQAQLGKAFAGWSGGVPVMRSDITAPKAGKAQERVVQMPGKTSVTLLVGQASGIDYHHPDAIALRVGTAILGSGFTGRLMSTVRDKEGLTYGIGAGVSGDTFSDGSWTISATFSPDLLDKGIASTRRELQKWWNEGITAAELNARKTNMVGSYQVGLSTTGGIAGALLRAATLGYDMTWVDEYPKKIEALTVDQVNAAIRKHLNPATMTLVKAGTLKTAQSE
jgi:zinc protease